MTPDYLSRREFLKLGALGIGATVLRPLSVSRISGTQAHLPVVAEGERLGRVAEEMDKFVNTRTQPSSEAPLAGEIAGDTVLPWLREVVGYTPYRNQRWVETPQGYIWSPLLQPVRNIENAPLETLPDYGGGPGLWMQVTVPFVEAQLEGGVARGFRVSYLVTNNFPIRFYYGQVLWVDGLRINDAGKTEYHVRELHGSRGDEFWAPAAGFKPIHPEDVSPISPEVEDKQLVINLARQTLSCYEEGREIYFCRVSTGRFGEDTQTPVGDYLRIFMKFMSTHMEGGATGAGYDLSGIGWATFIATGGIAIHSTYWHNNFGERTSAGCVNVTPEDAQFVYRWTSPDVPYYPGKEDQVAGTAVRVVEA